MFFDMDIKNIGVADYNKCIFVCDSKNRQLSVLYLFIVIKWLYTEVEQFKKVLKRGNSRSEMIWNLRRWSN